MLKKYLQFLNESNNTEIKSFYNPKNLISEICISMLLINSEFLDNILDRGLKARYSENSSVFLTDLKNLLLSKNRLCLGKFIENKCVEDNELSKVNSIFDSVEFNIEENWNTLVNSRISARSISDKILPDEKLSENLISKIYWIGPNKSKEYQEDIVIETNDGVQYSINLNKSLSLQKTSSFSLFADDLIGNNIDKLYNQENIKKWNKLTQEWVRIIYEGSHKSIQSHIEKFIDTKRIDSLDYFGYFDLRHRDPRYRHLGEYFKEFEKNILKFSDLMNEIWKKKELCLLDVESCESQWKETKNVILNSRIIEHLFTTSLKSDNPDDVKKVDEKFKEASGTVKMKIMKTIVDKMGCLERNVYYVSTNGTEFHSLPDRGFFRENYDNIKILFDYHVSFNSEDVGDDFTMSTKLLLNDSHLLDMELIVKFTGGFSSKLSAKYKYSLPVNFNYMVSKSFKSEEF